MKLGTVNIIFNEDRTRVLIGLKDPTADRPMAGQWMIPGGRNEENETCEACAIRETFEETGLKSSHVSIIHTTPSTAENGYRICYALVHIEPNQTPVANDDLVATMWVPREMILDFLGPWHKTHMPKAVIEYIRTGEEDELNIGCTCI